LEFLGVDGGEGSKGSGTVFGSRTQMLTLAIQNRGHRSPDETADSKSTDIPPRALPRTAATSFDGTTPTPTYPLATHGGIHYHYHGSSPPLHSSTSYELIQLVTVRESRGSPGLHYPQTVQLRPQRSVRAIPTITL